MVTIFVVIGESSGWELIIVNSVDDSFSLTPARASDRRATTRRGFLV